MNPADPGRRRFLGQSGSALGATWLAASLPAFLTACQDGWDGIDETAPFANLSPAQAATMEAIAAQIIPTTDTPGAREAGVIHFIDAGLGSFFSSMAAPIKGGIAAVEEAVHSAHPDAGSFADLGDEEQIAILESVESAPYFGLMQFLTCCGMFSHPKHGGNREKVGWELLGFEDQSSWQPPFGHYDTEVHDG